MVPAREYLVGTCRARACATRPGKIVQEGTLQKYDKHIYQRHAFWCCSTDSRHGCH